MSTTQPGELLGRHAAGVARLSGQAPATSISELLRQLDALTGRAGTPQIGGDEQPLQESLRRASAAIADAMYGLLTADIEEQRLYNTASHHLDTALAHTGGTS